MATECAYLTALIITVKICKITVGFLNTGRKNGGKISEKLLLLKLCRCWTLTAVY